MNRFITWDISHVMNLFIIEFGASVVNVGAVFFILIRPPYVKMAAGSGRPPHTSVNRCLIFIDLGSVTVCWGT